MNNRKLTIIISCMLVAVLVLAGGLVCMKRTSTDQTNVTSEKKYSMQAVCVKSPELVKEDNTNQQIAVVWDNNVDDVKSAELVCTSEAGEAFRLKETERTEKTILFEGDCSALSEGAYMISAVTYTSKQSEDAKELKVEENGIQSSFYVIDNMESAKIMESDAKNIVSLDYTSANDDSEKAAEQIKDQLENTLGEAVIEGSNSGNITVTLDPGHSGNDPGACYYGMEERTLNWKIAMACKAELEKYGVNVVVVRTENGSAADPSADSATELEKRAQIAADNNSNLLVSIHNNATDSHTSQGFMIFYPYNCSYQKQAYTIGQSVAEKVETELKALGLVDNGIKVRKDEDPEPERLYYPTGESADWYGIIRRCRLKGVPAILIEHAFMDNEHDAKLLQQDSFLNKLGVADATGIAQYFNLSKNGERCYGNDRYDTSIKIADRLKSEKEIPKFDNIIVGSGEDYPDALAGSTLSKAKNNAPVLLINRNAEAKVENYIKSNLVSGGTVYLLGGTGVVSSSFQSKLNSNGINVKRLGGNTRYSTNIEILKEAKVANNDEIIVCTGNNYADALSASGTGKPILLVNNSLGQEQISYLKSIGGSHKAYIIGGETVVATKIEREIKSTGVISSTERIFGLNRYETSAKIANKLIGAKKNVVLAYGQNFPDGLSSAPLAMGLDAPVLLADDRNYMYASMYAGESGAEKALTIGGASLISNNTVKKIIEAFSVGPDNYQIELGSYQNVVIQTYSSEKDITITSNDKSIATVSNIVTRSESSESNVVEFRVNGLKTGKTSIKVTYLGHTKNIAVEVMEERCYGSDRYETSIDVANKIKTEKGVSKFNSIIVCSGEDYPDALTGSALAKANDNAPILLVNESNENKIANYIKNNLSSGGRVYLLGGEGAVSSSFESQLKSGGITTKRLGGDNKYQTNINIIKEAGISGNDDIVFCTESSYADALSISAYGKPIFLVGSTLTQEQIAFLNSLSGNHKAYIIGGDAVVSTDVENELKKCSVISSVQRIVGQNRYETSQKIADTLFGTKKTVVLAYGENFPDGLSAAPLAMVLDAPLLLVNNDTYKYAGEYVRTSAANRIVTIGGPSLISEDTVYKIRNYTGEILYEIAGTTSVTAAQMVNYYKSSGKTFPSYYSKHDSEVKTIEDFCRVVVEEANAEGIKAEVVFCQSMKETGWLQFGGDVNISQYNFAGLGATGGGEPGNSFASVRIGIRAQVQHLKAYATTAALNQACVDQRFSYVIRGCAEYVEWLGQKENPNSTPEKGIGWATGKNYGYDIVNMIKILKTK